MAGPIRAPPIQILLAIALDDDVPYRDAIAVITGGAVDHFDPSTGTPVLQELEVNYDCVFVHGGNFYADRAAMSDVLVAYVDAGNVAVLGAGAGLMDDNGLGGLPIMSDTYSPVATSGAGNFSLEQYAGDGASIFHTDVTDYGIGVWEVGVVAQGMGVIDGTYMNGEVTTGYRPDYRVVYLNGTGHSQAQPTGDWPTLTANACAAAFVQ